MRAQEKKPDEADGSSETGERGQMPMTRWTIVCQAQSGTEHSAHDALSQLCQMYWFPLYAFARRWGCSTHDAEDVTQDFFAKLMSKHYLADVSREKGKLRSFLLKALTNHLHKWKRREQAVKRGGKQKFISIDQAAAEERYRLEPVDELSPDIVFERHWALTLMKHAQDKLKQEYDDASKGDLFEALRGTISLSGKTAAFAEIASQLGMKEDAVRQAARRLKVRFKERLEAEIGETVNSKSEVDQEVIHLLGVFR